MNHFHDFDPWDLLQEISQRLDVIQRQHDIVCDSHRKVLARLEIQDQMLIDLITKVIVLEVALENS